MKIVFFGTPDFAVPTLRALAATTQVDISLVVTQPDRPAGRGRSLVASPVRQAARDLGLPLLQPATLRDPATQLALATAEADLFVVAAYGLIFGSKTLAIPRLGCLNVHASLLPRYRGASPIAAAILAGDDVTGVSLMRMERGLDTGPVFAAATEPIRHDDTTERLTGRLAELGAALTAATLPAIAAGESRPVPQAAAGASLTRPLVKSDGRLDWRESPGALERRIRAMWPWPRAWTSLGDEPLQVHAATVVRGDVALPPGSLLPVPASLTVACGRDALALTVVQPAGGRPMSGAAFALGRRPPPARFDPAAEPPSPLITPVSDDAR